MLTVELNLRDSVVGPGRKPRRPWGLPDRVWQLALQWTNRYGLEDALTIRLAALYHSGNLLTPVPPKRKYEHLNPPEAHQIRQTVPDRVVVKPTSSPETIQRIKDGLVPGVVWRPGVGGVRAWKR